MPVVPVEELPEASVPVDPVLGVVPVAPDVPGVVDGVVVSYEGETLGSVPVVPDVPEEGSVAPEVPVVPVVPGVSVP